MATVTSITISPSPASMYDDDSLQFTSTVHFDDATSDDATPNTQWLSSDETVATINGGLILGPGDRNNPGLAIAVAAGTTTITARFYVGVTGEVTAAATLTVTPAAAVPEPTGRLLLAFDNPTLAAHPAWTRIDDHPNLVTSYTIDRGRSYELDRTDVGRAIVQIADPTGLLDPTNPSGPYYGKLQPLLQAAIGRQNPVTGGWTLRYRGFIEDYDYSVDPSQRVNRLTMSLVDLFEIVSAAEMQPAQFGDNPPTESTGQVYFFSGLPVEQRIVQILTDFGLSKAFRVVFTGNVTLKETVYSPGESALTAIQEAADGEFPAVANVYCDRKGRIVFHDRTSKFDPAGRAAAVGAAMWDYHEWKAGDGAAVNGSPTDTVPLRSLGFNRGLSRIINSATATPVDMTDDQASGQIVTDPASISKYGIRSWSADSLLTRQSLADGADDLTETRRFASYYVANYAQPQNRITDISFRPLRPADPRAPALWAFLNTIDIGDTVTVTAATAGGGGFSSEQYFVEGIHEDVRPLAPGYDDVTLRLDLSPRSYFATSPWP